MGRMTSFLVWMIWLLAVCLVGWMLWPHIRKMASNAPANGGGVDKPLRSTGKKHGLRSDILREGAGPGAKNRDLLTVHYVG